MSDGRTGARALIRISLFVLLLLPVGIARVSAAEAYFLSYPDIQSGRIVFLHQNDLWWTATEGGVAHRLTADGRPKSDVRLSHDGRRVAYTMMADGNLDVYVLNVDGGPAERVTHHPTADRAVAWFPGDRSLVIASKMTSPHSGVNQLFRVDASGGLPQPLPIAYGETAALSPDGRRLIYTTQRDFQDESWKRYRGGRAPHLRLLDLDTGKSQTLTGGEFSDSSPIWVGDVVFFLSERGAEHRSNLWSVSLSNGALEQLTHYQDFDVRHPAGGRDGVVFELGGRLGLFDPRTHAARELSIETPSEVPGAELRREPVADEVESGALVPGTAQTIVAAHGELFLIGAAATDPVINLTRTSDAAERYPTITADGRRLAFFSDAGGEYQLYVKTLPAGAAVRVTHFPAGMRFQPQWSPDGRRVAFIDSEHDISIVDVETAKVTVVDRDRTRDPAALEGFRVSWSPDSRWLAYSRNVDSGNEAVFLYDIRTGRRSQITSGDMNEREPVFAASGRFLFFASSQALKPTYGDVDSTWTFADSAQLVVLPLQAGTRAEWPSDCKCFEYDPQHPVVIDFDGLEQRKLTLPIPRGVLTELRALPGRLVYRRLIDSVEGQGSGEVESFDLTSGHTQTLSAKVDQLIDADGQRVLFRRGAHLSVRSPQAATPEQELPTQRLFMIRDRQAENAQQLLDAWRYARDFFYDAQLHGVDWPAIRDRYLPLARRATTDEDMSFVLREVAGELGAGHTWAYSGHGHPPGWSDACVGLLGADFAVSQGAYQIRRIYDGGSTRSELRSPLADAALGVHEGTFLLEVNGRPLTVAQDPWAALDGECDTEVTLTINDAPRLTGARRIQVRTLRSEVKLRERAWAQLNQERVHALSGGRLGYVYVPDTAANGQTELMRQFRAEFRRPGLVIDERFNRGGAFGDRLVELLDRPPLAFFAMRNATSVPLPELAGAGPKALLINGWSYSGGDGFPFLFHAAHAGTVIGTQTAGGFIGPGNPLRLVSGGVISVPVQRAYGADGRWAGEGRGAPPDLEIDNDPAALARGEDAQLDAAVSLLLRQLTTQPVISIPPVPPIDVSKEK